MNPCNRKKTRAEGCSGQSFPMCESPPMRTIINDPTTMNGKRRTKEGLGEVEEKDPKSVINNNGGKRANPMRSEEQVTQGVKIDSKIVVAGGK